MLYLLEGNDFLIRQKIEEIISARLPGLFEEEKKRCVIRNPISVSAILDESLFSTSGKVIIWDYDEFIKLPDFKPYVIPNDVDVILYGASIDKRKVIIKQFLAFNPEVLNLKDLYTNQVESWIISECNSLKIKYLVDGVRLLTLYYGNNLGEIADVLKRFSSEFLELNVDNVNKYCVQVNKFSIFDLQDSVFSKNARKSVYIIRRMLKTGEQNLPLIRYLMSIFYKKFVVSLGDNELIDTLKLHPYVLKKLNGSPYSIGECVKALMLLADLEKGLFFGFSQDYKLDRTIFKICKLHN